MKRTLSKTLVGTLLLVMAIAIAPQSATAQKLVEKNVVTKSAEDDDRKAIEEIVRQYLLSNPQIIQEALDELKKQTIAKQRAELAKKLRSVAQELYRDDNAPYAGDKNSVVPIVVFFDYNCGYCKSTLPALDAIVESDPKAKIIYKEFPILGTSSTLAAKAALAAREQGKYKEFHAQLLFASEINLEVIKSISESLKLDTPALVKRMNSPEIEQFIKKNYQTAEKLGLNGTPVYIVGDQVIPGAIDVVSLTRLLEQERTKKKKD